LACADQAERPQHTALLVMVDFTVAPSLVAALQTMYFWTAIPNLVLEL
jgi:hypothetical protein